MLRRTGWLTIGPKVFRFEQMLSDLVDTFLRRPPNACAGGDDRLVIASSFRDANQENVLHPQGAPFSRTDFVEPVVILRASICRENRP